MKINSKYLSDVKGINQNELIYDFMLEKSWRHTLDTADLNQWLVNNF